MDMSKYRVDPERKMRLSDYPQWEDAGYTKEELTEKMIPENVEKLRDLQLRLHAEEEKGIFVILQAIDTAGKDEIITFIFSHLMPQGLKVTPTKKPTEEELKHDFLWRIHAGKPERGQVGILNRSYYEDLLAPKVYQGIEDVPIQKSSDSEEAWEMRCQHVNAFEKYMVENGFPVVKFFLSISKEEQRKRLLERMKTPEKNWEFSFSDIKDREKWDTYQKAYEEMLDLTSTTIAPWYVLPADNDWFARYLASEAMVQVLGEIDPQFPVMTDEDKQKLEEAIQKLENEGKEDESKNSKKREKKKQ